MKTSVLQWVNVRFPSAGTTLPIERYCITKRRGRVASVMSCMTSGEWTLARLPAQWETVIKGARAL